MTSYLRDNCERFGNYLSIGIMRSSICNAKAFCYITPVVLNEIGMIHIVSEEFDITKNHDVYTFILGSLFQISTSRNKKTVYTICFDAFMTQTNHD